MRSWVSACSVLEVEVTKGKGRTRRTCVKELKVEMKKLGLVKENARNRDRWRRFTTGNRSTLPRCGNEGGVLTDCILMILNVNDDDEGELAKSFMVSLVCQIKLLH